MKRWINWGELELQLFVWGHMMIAAAHLSLEGLGGEEDTGPGWRQVNPDQVQSITRLPSLYDVSGLSQLSGSNPELWTAAPLRRPV